MENSKIDSADIKNIRLNIKDGLATSTNPIDDAHLLADLKLKMSLFDNALEGLTRSSKEDIINYDDMLSLNLLWINLDVNLKKALALIEHVDNALNKGAMNIEDEEGYFFQFKPLRDSIAKYREYYSEINKRLEEQGLR